MKIRDRLGDFAMPKTICVAGSAVLPPVAVVILSAALFFGGGYIATGLEPLRDSIKSALPFLLQPISPETDRAIIRAAPYVFLGIVGSLIWVALGLTSYIHCHRFWHDEKPQWAKTQSDLNDDFEDNFMDCPECEQVEPEKWHWVGACAHYGTTP